jgi:hypothetical protein
MYDLGMTAKSRLSVTVDEDLIEAGQAAVAVGEAESISGWVNDALRQKVDHERKLRGLDEFIKAFEAEYGEITDEELDAAYRAGKARAIVIRGGEVHGAQGTGAA